HVHICCIVFSADCAWSRVHTATLNLGFRIVRTGGCHACALHFSRNHNATQRTLVAISSGGRFDVCVCLHCHSDGVFGATARAVGGLLFLLLVVWAGDIFAYFVGKSLGSHRMSPRVSPNKTWEGAVASVLASIAVGMLMFHYAVPISTGLLHAHLIDLRDGIFSEPRSLVPIVILS